MNNKHPVYFDNASTSHPKAPGVPEIVKDILERGCFNINRGGYSGAYEMSELVLETRDKLAALFDCPSGRQVVFTGGITQSLNVVLKGLLIPGDNVIITQMEHNAVVRPLTQLRQQGVRVETVQCCADGTLNMADMEKKINERVKLVVMTHASNVCGALMPVRKVGEICRERGALLLVDSAQTAGVIPISMRSDNIDILAFSGHKGLLSAQGIGGFVLSQETADLMVPLIAGGTGSRSHLEEMPAELPDKFEAGTLNLPGIAALSAALDYIGENGVSAINAKVTALLVRLTEGLKRISGLRVIGSDNPEDKCAIAALDFPGMDNAIVSERLDAEFGIMTRCGLHCAPLAHKALGTYPRGVVRCSIGYHNTEEEIDFLLTALCQINTPRQHNGFCSINNFCK